MSVMRRTVHLVDGMIRHVALTCVVLILHPDAASVVRAATETFEEQTTASARSETPKWELEFHVGAIGGSDAAAGAPSLPGSGTPFVSFSGAPSRRISSWLFGDGAALANQAFAGWVLRRSDGVVSLDAVLSSAAIQRPPTTSIGFKLGRRFHDRFTSDLAIEYSNGSIALAPDAIAGIEATRVSAVATFRDLLFLSRPTITGTTDLRARGGGAVTVTGAFTFEPTSRRFSPFLNVGAGVMCQMGPQPTADVRLEYALRNVDVGLGFPTVILLTERDNVTIRYSGGRVAPVVEAGGGVKYSLSAHWMVRLDVKGQFTRSRLRVELDAVPESEGLGFAAGLATNPPIQFSGNVLGIERLTSTLSGPAIRNFVVFDSTRVHTQLSISTGLVWRF